MTDQLLSFGPYTVRLLSEAGGQAIVYCPQSAKEALPLYDLLPAPRPALAAIDGIDWDRELSPWPAPRAFKGGTDFGGEAQSFLDALTSRILPGVEAALGAAPTHRVLAGYSLGGLFALWSATRTDAFDRIASLSGSLWFDGFSDYLESFPPSPGVKRVFLSLGDREKNTKNPRMATVEDNTRRILSLLTARGVLAALEMNPGGHFNDVPQRIARGIQMTLT